MYHEMCCKVIRPDGKEAVFINGKQKSLWWDSVEIISNYDYIAEHDGKKAIFDIDNPDEPITDWWDEIYCNISMLLSKYYVAQKNTEGAIKQALFHVDAPYRPVSQWWDDIEPCTYLWELTYYKAKKDNKQALFSINDSYKPITGWWDEIDVDGLIEGKSDYYLVKNNGKQAMFHKDNPEQPITRWWDNIEEADHVLDGKPEYYIATKKKQAMFHKDDPDNPVTGWWDEVYPIALSAEPAKEQSYTVIVKQDGEIDILHIGEHHTNNETNESGNDQKQELSCNYDDNVESESFIDTNDDVESEHFIDTDELEEEQQDHSSNIILFSVVRRLFRAFTNR